MAKYGMIFTMPKETTDNGSKEVLLIRSSINLVNSIRGAFIGDLCADKNIYFAKDSYLSYIGPDDEFYFEDDGDYTAFADADTIKVKYTGEGEEVVKNLLLYDDVAEILMQVFFGKNVIKDEEHLKPIDEIHRLFFKNISGLTKLLETGMLTQKKYRTLDFNELIREIVLKVVSDVFAKYYKTHKDFSIKHEIALIENQEDYVPIMISDILVGKAKVVLAQTSTQTDLYYVNLIQTEKHIEVSTMRLANFINLAALQEGLGILYKDEHNKIDYGFKREEIDSVIRIAKKIMSGKYTYTLSVEDMELLIKKREEITLYTPIPTFASKKWGTTKEEIQEEIKEETKTEEPAE